MIRTRISKLLMLDFYSCGFLSLFMFCLAVWSCLLLWTCLKHRTLIFYPIFLHGYPSFPYPDCGSLHHDMLSIYFFPESPNNLPSIYQSIFLPITPGSHLYCLKPLSYPVFIIFHRYDREIFTGMCVVMLHKHMCVEVKGHLGVVP